MSLQDGHSTAPGAPSPSAADGNVDAQDSRFEFVDTPDEDPDAIKPALNRLREEQREALRRFRTVGFDSRAELLVWLHTFQYRTLGRVADWVYVLIPTKDVTVACCLSDAAARERHHPDSSLTAAERRSERRRQASKHLRPACRRALRELRTKANEYADVGDESPPDPDRAPHTVLRPVFDEYHQRQRRRLVEWLRGFDDVDALAEWVHDFDYDTIGELDSVPGAEEFDYELLEKRAARRVALGDEPRYVREREHLAARYLLPATNSAVRELAARAAETADDGSKEVKIPSG
jgi:hypothetical protein